LGKVDRRKVVIAIVGPCMVVSGVGVCRVLKAVREYDKDKSSAQALVSFKTVNATKNSFPPYTIHLPLFEQTASR
jgi:hypothetical protein